MKLKVLHVINTMLPGGAEMLLANSLSPGGLSDHTDNHLAFFMAPSYLVDKLDKSVKVHFLNYKGGTDLFRMITQLRKIIIQNKFDLVHTHLNPAGLYTYFACPKYIPQVHTMHTTYSMDNETSNFRKVIEKYLYLKKKSVNLINLSDYTHADFLNSFNFKGSSFILNNFVSDDFFTVRKVPPVLPRKSLKLIALGTLKPLKNFEYLLEVFKSLKNYNISLDIYGFGNTREYQKVIDQNSLKVRMMGQTNNLKDIISSYDLFIMPSKFEGFPLSVFEAMAAGVAVMVSNIPPLKSIIKEHGIYFELDNPAQVAEQLIDIYNNKIDIQALSLKASRYAEKTVVRERYIRELLVIYKKIVSNRQIKHEQALA